MTLEERTRRRVEVELDRLESAYGPFEIHETRSEVPPGRYDRARERFEAGSVGAAGVWLTNAAGEVLLVNDEDREGWSEPAGVALAHVLELVPDGRSAPPLTRLVVAFDGDYRGGDPRPNDDDIAAVEWWPEHPENLVYDGLAELDIPAASE